MAPEDVGLMQREAPRSWRMTGQSRCVTVMAAQADEATLMYVPEVSSSSMSSPGHYQGLCVGSGAREPTTGQRCVTDLVALSALCVVERA